MFCPLRLLYVLDDCPAGSQPSPAPASSSVLGIADSLMSNPWTASFMPADEAADQAANTPQGGAAGGRGEQYQRAPDGAAPASRPQLHHHHQQQQQRRVSFAGGDYDDCDDYGNLLGAQAPRPSASAYIQHTPNSGPAASAAADRSMQGASHPPPAPRPAAAGLEATESELTKAAAVQASANSLLAHADALLSGELPPELQQLGDADAPAPLALTAGPTADHMAGSGSDGLPPGHELHSSGATPEQERGTSAPPEHQSDEATTTGDHHDGPETLLPDAKDHDEEAEALLRGGSPADGGAALDRSGASSTPTPTEDLYAVDDHEMIYSEGKWPGAAAPLLCPCCCIQLPAFCKFIMLHSIAVELCTTGWLHSQACKHYTGEFCAHFFLNVTSTPFDEHCARLLPDVTFTRLLLTGALQASTAALLPGAPGSGRTSPACGSSSRTTVTTTPGTPTTDPPKGETCRRPSSPAASPKALAAGCRRCSWACLPPPLGCCRRMSCS